MSLMEKVAHFVEEEAPSSSLWQLLGPLFILCTFALAPKEPLILCVGIVGLFLTARWQVRGLSYALILLGLTAIAEHAFLTNFHLWQLGLEGSYAIAFFINALSSEQKVSFYQSLSSQLDARASSIQNLEEEVASLKETSTEQQVAFQEKVGSLQKELEEAQTEHSSILILNEVLRQTNARETAEKEVLRSELLGAHGNLALLKNEFERVENELNRLSNADALAIENKQLMAEINAARVDREQARLISETLAKLHAKESFKARETASVLVPLQEENHRLKQQLLDIQRETGMLASHMDQIGAERERHKIALQKLEEIQVERNQLIERLEKAELELIDRRENLVPAEEVAQLEEKLASFAQIEALYKQLRAQFEEKNQVLHQVRADLFHADTQLQTLKMEKEQKELLHNPISEEMRRELTLLEEELAALELENQELEELVTALSETSSEDAARRKKKVKAKSDPNQELLF